MPQIKADICIIGAGSGGLSVAAGAAQMGARTVLIEGHKMGGDCLNYGCVPSKALLSFARKVHTRGHPTPEDYRAALAHVAATIATIAPVDAQERFEGFGVQVIRDWARFNSPNTAQAGDIEITARRFVIATGSSPLIPPIPGLADVPYLTNETLFDLTERPDHLIIIGAGPIGMEMAQAHRRLGSQVTVIDAGPALPREDPALTPLVLNQLRAEGVILLENTAITGITQVGGVTVQTVNGPVTGTHLLVATGRKVNLDRLDLSRANVAHDAKGVKTGPNLRSLTNKCVFAVGDAAGGLMFTHVAGYHAGIVIRQAMFALPSRARTDHMPRATFTDPELAHVGLTEAEARKRYGPKVEVVSADMAHNDRAIAEGTDQGQVKLIIARGRPVGATIVAAGAGDLISFWALAISARLKLSAVAGVVLPYPTRSEVNKRAASAYFAPKLFGSARVKWLVSWVQRWIP